MFSLDSDDTDLMIALRTLRQRQLHDVAFATVSDSAVGTPGRIDDDRLSLESGRLYAAVPSIAINLLADPGGDWSLCAVPQPAQTPRVSLAGVLPAVCSAARICCCLRVNGVVPLVWNNLMADPLIYFFTIMQIQFTFSFAGQRVGRGWRAV